MPEIVTVDELTLSVGDVFTTQWMGDESMAMTTVKILSIQTEPIITITGKQQ